MSHEDFRHGEVMMNDGEKRKVMMNDGEMIYIPRNFLGRHGPFAHAMRAMRGSFLSDAEVLGWKRRLIEQWGAPESLAFEEILNATQQARENVFSYYRMCSLPIHCHCENVFSYYRMCSLQFSTQRSRQIGRPDRRRTRCLASA